MQPTVNKLRVLGSVMLIVAVVEFVRALWTGVTSGFASSGAVNAFASAALFAVFGAVLVSGIRKHQ